jgi:hypothetical protein
MSGPDVPTMVAVRPSQTNGAAVVDVVLDVVVEEVVDVDVVVEVDVVVVWAPAKLMWCDEKNWPLSLIAATLQATWRQFTVTNWFARWYRRTSC